MDEVKIGNTINIVVTGVVVVSKDRDGTLVVRLPDSVEVAEDGTMHLHDVRPSDVLASLA